jgi:hypothetical protein
MKYIKKYKLFESKSDIFDDIFDDVSDILSGIEDEGFSVDKATNNWVNGVNDSTAEMKIFIEKMVGDENGYKSSKPYIVNDTMLDSVQHLSSYLSKNGYKLIVEAVSKTDVIAHQEYYHRDLGDNISEIQELFSFIGRAPIDYLRLLIYKHNK